MALQQTVNCVDQDLGPTWSLYNGDCVEVLRGIPDSSIDYSIFSPPFESLYTYSNSPRDMGNCKDGEQFFEHFGFLLEQLARVMAPCRDISVHCMLLPTSKVRHGVIGLRDFRGEIIRAFEAHGLASTMTSATSHRSSSR